MFDKNCTVLFIMFLVVDNLHANVKEVDGKQLFQNNCGVCHSWDKEIQGPALGSILKKRKKEWLLSFIRSSQNMIAQGDTNAIFLYEQYNHAVMPDFSRLNEQQVTLILEYIQKMSEKGNETQLSVPIRYDPALEEADVLRGKTLFANLCEGCHQLRHEVFGPALVSVSKRKPHEWLIKFITNSQEVIKSGDPYAVHLYEQYDKKWMLPFTFLKREEIESILLYISVASESPSYIQGVNGRKIQSKNQLLNKSEKLNYYNYFQNSEDVYVEFKYFLIALTALTVIGSLLLLSKFSKIFH